MNTGWLRTECLCLLKIHVLKPSLPVWLYLVCGSNEDEMTS